MLHGRTIRPPAVGATLLSVDDSSIGSMPGARVVRIGNFLGVCAEREWDAVRAARQLKARWSPGTGLPDHAGLFAQVRATPVVRDETLAERGDVSLLPALAGAIAGPATPLIGNGNEVMSGPAPPEDGVEDAIPPVTGDTLATEPGSLWAPAMAEADTESGSPAGARGRKV